MRFVNVVVGGVIDALLFPFRELPPLVGLCVMSILTAVGILLVVKATSDQRRVIGIRRNISAAAYEMLLFRHDPVVVLRSQAQVLRHTATYLRLSLVPALWMFAPLVLVVAHLQSQFGYAGLDSGDTAIVKVKFVAPTAAPISLEADTGLVVQTALLEIPALREAVWRIGVRSAGEHELRVRVGDQYFTKQVQATTGIRHRTPLRPRGFLDQVLYPVERPLPRDGPIDAITVTHAAATIPFLFWDGSWLVAFFVVTLGTAWLLQKRLGVVL